MLCTIIALKILSIKMSHSSESSLDFNLNHDFLQCPDSPLALNSKFYIERPPIENKTYKQIIKPGSVIRIRASRKMGKSSLMLRLIEQANSLGYSTVLIDFQQADIAIFENLNRFLRWLCSNITRQLGLTSNLNDYWDEDIGDKVSCSIYFEQCLLPQIDSSLVLVLNEVNRIFEYSKIFQDFLPLLRFWHEQSAQSDLWKKLRLVLVHSTEAYISLHINQSPFNVGLLIELPEFTHEQIKELTHRYQLNLTEDQIQKLIKLVGGHPYLIHLAIHHLYHHQGQFDSFLEAAPTQTGIYQSYLRQQWIYIQKKPEIVEAIQQLINQKNGIQLEPLASHYLYSIGLIKKQEKNCILACELYRIYFSFHCPVKHYSSSIYIEKLEQENKSLSDLVYVDNLTKIPNRSQFNKTFQIEWECMAIKMNPLSLIICDIDYFKVYNDTFGHLAGDLCLQKVAQGIQQYLQRPNDLLARYGGEEFVIVLPQTDANGAIYIAEKIRLGIKNLAIASATSPGQKSDNSIVTISLGIACIIPNSNHTPDTLFVAADQALYESKTAGRDRTTLSSVFNFKY